MRNIVHSADPYSPGHWTAFFEGTIAFETNIPKDHKARADPKEAVYKAHNVAEREPLIQ